MTSLISKILLKEKRHARIRAKIKGVEKKPRLSVFRSSNHIYAQLVDDENGRSLVHVSDLNFKKAPKGKSFTKGESKKTFAFKVGELLAEKALVQGLKEVVFDRRGYKFHGRVAELAKGAREGGLKF